MSDTKRLNTRDDEGEDEDEEEVDETGYKSAKDAILFAIDVSPSMLAAPPPSDSRKADTDSATLAALKCAYALMQQRIISNPNDMMGILLFGTEKSKFHGEEQSSRGGLTYPHCYLLADLDVPAAEDVKALRSLVEDEEESKSTLIPSEEPVSMANLLFCANQIFTTKAPNFSSRRLFIVTDNDDPHRNDRALRSAATIRAKDLYDLGVIIELFPISQQGHNFDRENFYGDIIYQSSPMDPDAPAAISAATKASSTGDGISLLNSLLSSINSKSVARRALFSNIPFEIGPGFKISVKGYILFKRQEPARSCYIWLGGEQPQLAKGITTLMAEDTARPVEKVEVKKAYKFGGEQVSFTPEEVNSIRYFGDPIIRICGFKPLSLLPIWAAVKQSTFIYPSEEDFVGSTRVFSALQQKMLRDEKMAIAWYIARKNAAPVMAAIIPGAEKLGESNEQVMPPGMWLVPLPFADDIRQNPEVSVIRAPDSLIDCMRKVVQQLQLPKAQYDPMKYPNPALQWHYRILQTMALDEEMPLKPEDKTIPKYKQIDKRAGAYVVEWGHELEAQYQLWAKEHGPSKRPALFDTGHARKKVKTGADISTNQVDDVEVRKLFDANSVSKLTVPALKSWLVSKNLSPIGHKTVLVSRVEGYFKNKQGSKMP